MSIRWGSSSSRQGGGDFEGIEEEQQRTFLMECGFNYGQGYYFDRPLPLEEFEKVYLTGDKQNMTKVDCTRFRTV